MRFNCPSCGSEFEDIQQLANHKRLHQSTVSQEKKGVICLGCGKAITISSTQQNYSGPLTCPSCKRTMSVKLQDGEVIVARLG